MAAIEALRALDPGIPVILRSDSQYLVKTMNEGWRRTKNVDLWKQLDGEVARHDVRFEWVRGHAGDARNEEADALAREAARSAAKGRAPRRPGEAGVAPATPAPTGGARRRTAAAQSAARPRRSAWIACGRPRRRTGHEKLRPLLDPDERIVRCAACERAFRRPRRRTLLLACRLPDEQAVLALCSLAACQLKARSGRAR